MLRRIARISAPLTLTASVTLAWLFAGCGTDVTIAEMLDAAPPSFASPDAEPVVPKAGLTEYCPSSECPAGHTTCPTSRFRCEVNLWTDSNNCGECGNVCPEKADDALYACVNGRCELACRSGAMNCDGVPDNGCETSAGPDNCGACGKTCPDPADPCVHTNQRWRCGCLGDDLLCGVAPYYECVDGRADDGNCGTCGNVCDRFGNGAPAFDHTYYGCIDGKCGGLKCETNFGNCDGKESNGCETELVDDANCGACGNACPSNTKCLLDEQFQPFCACPGNQTPCPIDCFGSLCSWKCFDLTSHPDNCGACGISCGVSDGFGEPICNYGACSYGCAGGWADCNGSPIDRCEVNTQSDPQNCGGCGVACDGVAGQACVAGQCVVEPCDSSSDGGVTAR